MSSWYHSGSVTVCLLNLLQLGWARLAPDAHFCGIRADEYLYCGQVGHFVAVCVASPKYHAYYLCRGNEEPEFHARKNPTLGSISAFCVAMCLECGCPSSSSCHLRCPAQSAGCEASGTDWLICLWRMLSLEE